jgi:ABC-type uncharacterized transport system auxiliary subunit
MKTIELLLVVTLTAALAGCGSSSLREKQTFIPDVQRPAKAAAVAHKDMALKVAEFAADSAFRSKGLLYRKSDSQYAISYYTELMQPPATLFTDETRQWLAASGVCTVLMPGSLVPATHILEGRISEYYIDLRQPKTPTAVLKVEIVLLGRDDKQGTLIHRGFYMATEPLKQDTGEAAVAAMAVCIEKVLSQFEADLAKVSG